MTNVMRRDPSQVHDGVNGLIEYWKSRDIEAERDHAERCTTQVLRGHLLTPYATLMLVLPVSTLAATPEPIDSRGTPAQCTLCCLSGRYIQLGGAAWYNETVSGSCGVIASSPTVGKTAWAALQTISLLPGENINVGKRIDSIALISISANFHPMQARRPPLKDMRFGETPGNVF